MLLLLSSSLDARSTRAVRRQHASCPLRPCASASSRSRSSGSWPGPRRLADCPHRSHGVRSCTTEIVLCVTYAERERGREGERGRERGRERERERHRCRLPPPSPAAAAVAAGRCRHRRDQTRHASYINPTSRPPFPHMHCIASQYSFATLHRTPHGFRHRASFRRGPPPPSRSIFHILRPQHPAGGRHPRGAPRPGRRARADPARERPGEAGEPRPEGAPEPTRRRERLGKLEWGNGTGGEGNMLLIV